MGSSLGGWALLTVAADEGDNLDLVVALSAVSATDDDLRSLRADALHRGNERRRDRGARAAVLAASSQPKKLMLLDTGDHCAEMLRGSRREEARAALFDWLERYLPSDGTAGRRSQDPWRPTMAIVERRWGSLGVPSSAGAQTPGLEKGPAAIRAAGFIDCFRRGGGSLDDHGDVAGFRWRPDPGHLEGQNATAVARVAAATADAVAEILGRGQTPLVIGGDCTITIGVVAGFARAGVEPALLYVDGGPDLYTPGASSIGHLDAMGLAHMLGLPGHLPEVAGIGPKMPLLESDHVVSYGAYLDDDDPEQVLLDQLEIVDIGAADIHRDVRTAAGRAIDHVEAVAPEFVVHCDADVLAFADTPLSDSPDSGGDPIGLTLDELATSLAIFAASPRFAGLVLTEVNPDHAPRTDDLRRFTTTVGAALAGDGEVVV